jgi:hypothetical protein
VPTACLSLAGFQAQHFLPSAWPEGDTISARGGLQSPQRAIGFRFGEVGLIWFFDESAQARQYAHGAQSKNFGADRVEIIDNVPLDGPPVRDA